MNRKFKIDDSDYFKRNRNLHRDCAWSVGEVLNTRITSRFTKEQMRKARELEARTVFAHFSSMDEGRSRVRVAEAATSEIAQSIVKIQSLSIALKKAKGDPLFCELKHMIDLVVSDIDQYLYGDGVDLDKSEKGILFVLMFLDAIKE